ncbi:MAG: hypothetical protein M9904_02450 [Chitinophagaceae bacterium]|nr:hypothetical protein [Chitinophagaceae bacterium]
MNLSERAISAIRHNIKCIAALMVEFNRGQWTIQDWLDPDHKFHCQLVQMTSLRIISEYTGLSKDEILEEIPSDAERLPTAV